MTTPDDDSALIEVQVRDVPVALWAASQEHFAELMREFALIAASSDSEAVPAGSVSRHQVPQQLLELVEQLTSRYGGFTTAQEQALSDAAERGTASIDLVFHVPASAAQAALTLGDLLDEADEFCRSGDHLLTLATPPECVDYRRWYLGQFTDQAAGKDAVSWADFSPRSTA